MDSKLDRSFQYNVPGMSANAIFSCKDTGITAQNKDRQFPLYII
jgi:hypothetical protein